MRTSCSALVLSLVVLAGCSPVESASGAPPMSTTGPGQVVVSVPAMVCESCAQEVTEGLALLPWVDAGSIQPDRKARQVRFRVKDRAAFDMEAVKETIARKGFKDVTLLTAPTES
jgi:copper chaperone CopZ